MQKLSLILKVFFVIVYFVLLGYVLLPTSTYPYQIIDSVQSVEDADTEDPLRRAYFTNFSREEVISYYESQLENFSLFNIKIPLLRLNYPPEDAYSIIRDQTRSTFLEEIVHPLRESFFINGFLPKVAKDDIWYKGVHYQQKITVRYVYSDLLVRVIATTVGFVLLWIILTNLANSISKNIKEWII